MQVVVGCEGIDGVWLAAAEGDQAQASAELERLGQKCIGWARCVTHLMRCRRGQGLADEGECGFLFRVVFRAPGGSSVWWVMRSGVVERAAAERKAA